MNSSDTVTPRDIFAMRPARIMLCMQAGPIKDALEWALGLMLRDSTLRPAETIAEADIVICTKVSDIQADFDPRQNYICFLAGYSDPVPAVPENVLLVSDHSVVDLARKISQIRRKLASAQ